MEEKTHWLSILLDKGIEFVKTSIELMKIRAVDKAAEIVSLIAARVAAALIFLSGLLMASVGLALWLGELLGGSWFGFFIVAGAYFLLAIAVYFILRNKVRKNVTNKLLQ